MFFLRSDKFRLTPRLLSRLLGATRLLAEHPRPLPRKLALLGPGADVFSAYPATWGLHVREEDREAFGRLSRFASAGKGEQRILLENRGIPTLGAVIGPAALPPGSWLVRPNHHFAGTNMDLCDGGVLRAGFYASEIQPIKKEFRTLFVHGRPLFTMYKPPNPDPNADSDFADTWSYTRLDRCGLNDQLAAFPAIRDASYCGVDIAWFGRRHQQPARVIEINFAPGLGPRNLETVASALRGEG